MAFVVISNGRRFFAYARPDGRRNCGSGHECLEGLRRKRLLQNIFRKKARGGAGVFTPAFLAAAKEEATKMTDRLSQSIFRNPRLYVFLSDL